MNRMKIMTLVGVLSLFGATQLFAEEAKEGPCRADMKRLCGDVKPGHGDIRECMKSHESELSQGCKDHMTKQKAKFEAKMKEIETACAADLKQFCANVTPGEGRQMACLKAYEDKLSAGCKEKTPRMHKMEKKPT